MRIPLLASAFVLACLFLACGDDASTGSTPSPTVDFAAEAARIVPDAVLTVDDLPGFEAQDVGALEEQANLSVDCNIFDAGLVFPDAVATAESDPFLGPGDQQAFNHVAIYETTDDASDGVAATQELLDRCEDEYKDVVDRIARDELDRLGIELGLFSDIDVTIGYYDPPLAGDEILGYRMNVSVDLIVTRQEYNLDVIIVREGRAVGALMFGTFGSINPENEASLVERAAAKLTAADESLPE